MAYFNHIKKQYQHKRKRRTIAGKSVKELVPILDRIFSEYIRLSKSDGNGYCQCITCGNIYHWKELHCGHFIGRANKAVRFNEMNCNPQCVRCNSFRNGEHHIYRRVLQEKYSYKAVEKLEHEALIGGSYDIYWLQEKIIEYREKVKILKIEKL
jgi:hypothetical protein